LNSRKFPHSTKAGWESSYTDFMFTCIQMNLYTLYHEMKEIKNCNKLTQKIFTAKLINVLVQKIVRTEDKGY
jgi:hypothetical protein